MIIYILSLLMLGFALYQAIDGYKTNPAILKVSYLSRPKDYIYALLLIVGVFVLFLLFSSVGLNRVLYISIPQLIGEFIRITGLIEPAKSTAEVQSAGNGSNAFFAFFFTGNFIFILLAVGVMVFCLPFFAYAEELIYRSYIFSLKERIISSLKFGFMHMLVGVPLIAALVLCVFGFTLSIIYLKIYDREVEKIGEPEDFFEALDNCNQHAIYAVTSIHFKYNFILLSLLSFVFLST
jgi:membrane protease YdiL (CAAX protease family)